MSAQQRPQIIAGNWKMNQNLDQIKAFLEELFPKLQDTRSEAWIAPQYIHIPFMKELIGEKPIKLGAQNCASQISGAFTGEVSPSALKELGIDFVIIGHSERRTLFYENDETLNQKLHLLFDLGLKVVFCVGETKEEREAGQTEAIIKKQLQDGLKGMTKEHSSQLIIAYEPVWAIGTGLSATAQQAQEVHAFIRREINGSQHVPILYGGSVKPDNIGQLLAQEDIDGALVGGASLKAIDFAELIKA